MRLVDLCSAIAGLDCRWPEYQVLHWTEEIIEVIPSPHFNQLGMWHQERVHAGMYVRPARICGSAITLIFPILQWGDKRYMQTILGVIRSLAMERLVLKPNTRSSSQPSFTFHIYPRAQG